MFSYGRSRAARDLHGAVIGCALVWIKDGTASSSCPDTSDKYVVLSQGDIVRKMLQHMQCYPTHCFKDSHGKIVNEGAYRSWLS